MRVDEEPHNHCVNLTVRPVTSLAKSGKRRTGPARRLRGALDRQEVNASE
jgi:hypothetical protein